MEARKSKSRPKEAGPAGLRDDAMVRTRRRRWWWARVDGCVHGVLEGLFVARNAARRSGDLVPVGGGGDTELRVDVLAGSLWSRGKIYPGFALTVRLVLRSTEYELPSGCSTICKGESGMTKRKGRLRVRCRRHRRSQYALDEYRGKCTRILITSSGHLIRSGADAGLSPLAVFSSFV